MRSLSFEWRPIIAMILFIICWEVAVRAFQIKVWFLPAPSAIFKAARDVLPTFMPHFNASLSLAIFGFIIGVSIGLLIAMALHVIPGVRRTIFPFIILSQNVPVIVLAPLLVIWFGFGFLPKLIIIVI